MPLNRFLTPDYEAALSDLGCGPMTSNAAGVLIRPVDQLAEAVRALHRDIAERDQRIAGLVADLREALGHIPHDARGSTFWEDDEGTYVECSWYTRLKNSLATPLTAAVEAVEGMRKALELSVPFLDHDSPRDLSSLKCTESCVRCKVSAALAAYEEANRG